MGGEAGCQVQFVMNEPEQPAIVHKIDIEDPSGVGEAIAQGTMGVIRQMEVMRGVGRDAPKIVLFLTTEEYEDLGSPAINEEFEVEFYTGAALEGPQARAPWSTIRLSRVSEPHSGSGRTPGEVK